MGAKAEQRSHYYWTQNRAKVVGYASEIHRLLQNPLWYSTLLEFVKNCEWDKFLTWVQTHPPDGPGIPKEEALCLADYLFHDCDTYPGYADLIGHNSPRW